MSVVWFLTARTVGRRSAIRQAECPNLQILPVLHSRDKRLVGYYEATDLLYAVDRPKLRAVSTFEENVGQIAVLNKMVSQDIKLGRIVNSTGQLVGVVLRDRLIAQMMQRN